MNETTQLQNPDQTQTSSIGDASAALDRYRNQIAAIESIHSQARAKDRAFGTARLISFLFALAFWVVGYGFDGLPVARIIGWVGFAVFIIVVTLNEPVRERIEQLRRERSVLARLVARLERDWDRLATTRLTKELAEVELPARQRDVAADLDLLGRASLFHFASMTATQPGIRTLVGWLTEASVAKDAMERTKAIETLAPMRAERLRYYVLSRQISESSGSPDRFALWARGEKWLPGKTWLPIWANVSAFFALVLLAAVLAGWTGLAGEASREAFKYGLLSLGGLALVNFVITSVFLGPAHEIFSIAMASRSAVADYLELFSSARLLPEDNQSGMLSRLRETLYSSDQSATEGMKRLQKVASAGGLRQSASTFLIYLPLQGFALWDVRVLRRLESWQDQYGSQVGDWFDSLGQFEALASLAALRDEYPGWVTPQWTSEAEKTQESMPSIIRADKLGHPLLKDQDRVTNDVSVGPSGTLLLVTGSNMSGKSTMLRSLGLNVALAGTGAPVCASSFSLPNLELGTSIRVSDNLSEGVSFYMAELQRLKQVVDHARDLSMDEGRTLLFLLDEILQGTNSRERQIAVVQVLQNLIGLGAIGAISTHDLELADEPELSAIAHTVHFRETITKDTDGNDTMTFDYKMRSGVSPTTNALRLLEMVGLGVSSKA